MHWIRVNREALYDGDEMARARAKRGLPDYEKVRAPRAAPANVICIFGCGAQVHYDGASCLPCRLARRGRAA